MPKTILIVDDEPDYREMTSELLQAHGFATASAADGDQALASLADNVPDLILLDLKMPRTDGWAVFVWIKSRPALKETPVIICSGSAIPPERKALINQKAPFWLEKPISPQQLLSALKKHFPVFSPSAFSERDRI